MYYKIETHSTVKMYAEYVLNPATNKKIRVGGDLYLRLKKQGVKFSNPFRAKLPSKRYYPKLEPEEEVKYDREIKNAKTVENVQTGGGRGVFTRGWEQAKPKRGRERRELYEACGGQCFLRPNPEDPGRSGYPICSKENDCLIDCRGIQRSYQLASMYDAEVKEHALHLRKEKGCRLPGDSPNSRPESRKSKRPKRRPSRKAPKKEQTRSPIRRAAETLKTKPKRKR